MEYIMTSYDLDEQFIDNMAQEYLDNEVYQMSDEEQKGFEDHITEENEEVLYEATEDTLVNTLVDGIFGMSSKQSRSERRAIKKAKLKSLPTIPKCKGVVNRHDENVNKLANHFNRRIK